MLKDLSYNSEMNGDNVSAYIMIIGTYRGIGYTLLILLL